jgi:adenine phosphoribosyltransferase
MTYASGSVGTRSAFPIWYYHRSIEVELALALNGGKPAMLEISEMLQETIKGSIRDVPDFPKEGILFKDITTLLQDGPLFNQVIDIFQAYCVEQKAEAIAAIESRGFIFGGALSDRLKIPFLPVRKEGKLPHHTMKVEYSLEYGEAAVEIHRDACGKGQRVIIVDDLLATGGTAAATAKLVENCGGEVAGMAFLIELSFLNGREALKDYDLLTVVDFGD